MVSRVEQARCDFYMSILVCIDGIMAIGMTWLFAWCFKPELSHKAVWFIAVLAAWMNQQQKNNKEVLN